MDIGDYLEYFFSNTWWISYNFGKALGELLTWLMPIVFGVMVKEAYANISATSNPWSLSVWIANWPILLILAIPLLFWGLGGLLLRFLSFKQNKSGELINSIKWMCEDIFTKNEIESEVRCTIWVPVGTLSRTSTNRLIQASDYFPSRSKLDGKHKYHKNGRRFRTYNVTKNGDPVGILGFAALGSLGSGTKNVYAEHIPANANFVDYMVKNWNFSKFKASHLTPDRKSYLCFPLLDRGGRKLLGILYFDANKPRTLSDDLFIKVEKYLPRFARILTSD